MYKINYNHVTFTLLGTLFFIAGCGTPPPPVPKVEIVETPKYVPHVTKRKHKNIKLKEVQDDNFSSDYMYPAAKKKKENIVYAKQNPNPASNNTSAPSTEMNRSTCINMIGQEKFDKYTQMLGDESAAIKRCEILKSM